MRSWWAVILVIGGAAYFAGSGHFGDSRPARFDTPTEKGPDEAPIFAGGIVEGTQPVQPVRFEIAGRVKRVFVREGEYVEKNCMLAELDPEPWQLRVSQAMAQLRIARAERARLLSTRNSEPPVRESVPTRGREPRTILPTITSQQELDRVRQANAQSPLQPNEFPSRPAPDPTPTAEELAIADARVSLADAAAKYEQCMLDKTRLLAPIAGTILYALPELGQLVSPTDEQEPFSIVNREQVRVRAFVEELDAMNIERGQRATIIAAGRPDRKYPGAVLSCSPYVHPKLHLHLKPGERIDVRVREVVIELDDGSDLLIGLPVDVFIDPAGGP